jgi:hypothetical protein
MVAAKAASRSQRPDRSDSESTLCFHSLGYAASCCEAQYSLGAPAGRIETRT